MKKLAIFIFGLIALILIIVGFWHYAQGGSVLYSILGIFYVLSLIFYYQKKHKALYINFSALMLVVALGCYLHGWGFIAL